MKIMRNTLPWTSCDVVKAEKGLDVGKGSDVSIYDRDGAGSERIGDGSYHAVLSQG